MLLVLHVIISYIYQKALRTSVSLDAFKPFTRLKRGLRLAHPFMLDCLHLLKSMKKYSCCGNNWKLKCLNRVRYLYKYSLWDEELTGFCVEEADEACVCRQVFLKHRRAAWLQRIVKPGEAELRGWNIPSVSSLQLKQHSNERVEIKFDCSWCYTFLEKLY